VRRKVRLLRLEGVCFGQDGRLCDPARVCRPS
jgi:hypothetical protein